MNFFKGLFSKQQKRNTNDKKSVQSNLALPALSVRNEVRIGDVSSYDKSNVTQLNGRNKTVHRQVSSTSDMIHGSKHLSDSIGIDNQSFADNETSSSNKPKRHRRKKKDRHKQSIEELSRSITYKTESSCVSNYSKTCVKRHYKKDKKMVFKTDYCLMQVKSIAECSKWSILQYF